MLNETHHKMQGGCGMAIGSKTLLVALYLAAGSLLHAHGQSALPPTQPTDITPSQLPSANPRVPTSREMDVMWDGRLLQISAYGQGLNEALRAIARRTGIHLTGSAPDEPLYGTYGPAPLADLFATLTDGLPVNLLFVDRSGSRPPELTLTQQNGAATPAQPQAQAQTYSQPQRMFQAQQPGNAPPGQPPAFGSGVTTPNSSLLNGQNADTQGQTTNSSSDASSNPESPNGVKTPQQIFEQLQRLRATTPKQ